jgi:hypothetical protein
MCGNAASKHLELIEELTNLDTKNPASVAGFLAKVSPFYDLLPKHIRRSVKQLMKSFDYAHAMFESANRDLKANENISS